ncbi:MAG TPA: Hsp20/alpha crystallin family protein [Candidatus Saccharimonadales bacterium]|nr:Hsp20/alpha crystallin family protein [Candidatus Saccharimonadales bacterium]
MANLQRWDPFAGLTSMHSQIDDMFNSFFGSGMPMTTQGMPAMDVYTTDDDKSLVAEVQAPGFGKDDINVTTHNGILEIRGEKHQKEEDGKNKRNYMVRESHASFYRSIVLPKAANGDEVKATFTDGVLKVTVPMQALPEPKRVAIEAGGKDSKSGQK